MISKELLSEVLGIEHILECRQSVNVFWVTDAKSHCGAIAINIYELAHRCKEWAFETKGVQIIHARKYGYGVGVVKYFSSIEVYNGHYLYNPSDELGTSTQVSFEADTEPEAIFRACQWVLDNKAKQ